MIINQQGDISRNKQKTGAFDGKLSMKMID